MTKFYLPRNQEMRREAAKNQADLRGDYAPPSEFRFRDEKPESELSGAFVTKFHLPNNQTMRRLAAVDQAGLHVGMTMRQVREDYDPRKYGKEEFKTRLPSECNKWGNLQYRLNVARDQAAMRGEWSAPADFQFREATGACTFHRINSAPRDVEMASRRRFPILSASEREYEGKLENVPLMERPDFCFLPPQPRRPPRKSGLAGMSRVANEETARNQRRARRQLDASVNLVRTLRSVSSTSGRNSPGPLSVVSPSVEDVSQVEFTVSMMSSSPKRGDE